MPLTFTAAHSSRVTKPRAKKPAFDRAAAASFAAAVRRRPAPAASKAQAAADDGPSDSDSSDSSRLSDHGVVTHLPPSPPLPSPSVEAALAHALSSMFDPIPDTRSGLSSTRTAEILRFRASLPPLVTAAHMHAMLPSATAAEREAAALARSGAVRRVVIPGRGTGSRAFGDALAPTDRWVALVHSSSLQDAALEDAYAAFVRSPATDASDLAARLGPDAVARLMRAGFLTASSAALRASAPAFDATDPGARASAASLAAVSRAAPAPLDRGGGGQRGLGSGSGPPAAPQDLAASLPNAGLFLKLLAGARAHLVALLARSKHREAPLYLLRERWGGAPASGAGFGRRRDPFAQVLPAKTRKWREFYGLRFEWVLAECVGAGMLELFETRSVGLGVRGV